MVGARLLGAALVASMAFLAGCRDEVEPQATPTATAIASTPMATSTATATAAATQPMWDARAVVAKPEAYFRIPCPAAADPARGNPGQVFNLDTPTTQACVQDAMRAAGTTEEAQAFLVRYGTFLVTFEERGRVDLGATAAAWVNMGRPEPVFVNAGPTGMLSLQVLVNGGAPNQPAKAWLARPDVVAALRGQTDVIAWAEYARVTSVEAPAGRQRFLAAIPVRACRACATLLELEVAFDFGADGTLLGAEPRPSVVATGTAAGSSGAQESGHAPGLPSRQP